MEHKLVKVTFLASFVWIAGAILTQDALGADTVVYAIRGLVLKDQAHTYVRNLLADHNRVRARPSRYSDPLFPRRPASSAERHQSESYCRHTHYPKPDSFESGQA